ncbi:acid protease [Mycena alexandri]|uniref:Acid protease n=1 Tax=Mycena alexandri TaxID=1745969 RepID=A0AAD6SLH5_9AGAR|nr:acid protease [Mycena alexandri]
MGFLALLSFLFLLGGTTRAEFQHTQQGGVALSAAQLPTASFTLPFTGKIPRREVKKNALAALNKYERTGNDTLRLDGASFENEYLVNITVGGKPFRVILDSGSSDLWVAHSNFSCLDSNGTVVPPATCDFGLAQFDPSQSPTFQPFPNVTFLVRYGSGEFLSGPAGFDTVVGMVPSEGVLGLAFSGLTSVWNTTSAKNTSGANHIPYTPFFINAVAQNKLEKPYFSVALNRPTFSQQVNDSFVPNLGFIAFGGIAPVPVLEDAVTVPVQPYAPNAGHLFVPSNASNATFEWYTIHIDAFTFPGSNDVATKSNNTFFDTGSTLNWLPSPVATAFNAQWEPPAVLDENTGLYTIDCNATAPPFAVVIAGTSFSIDARDLVIPQEDSNGNLICVSGNGDNGPDVPGNTFTLGDVFLHNVVATFNPVDAEVTLTGRVPY